VVLYYTVLLYHAGVGTVLYCTTLLCWCWYYTVLYCTTPPCWCDVVATVCDRWIERCDVVATVCDRWIERCDVVATVCDRWIERCGGEVSSENISNKRAAWLHNLFSSRMISRINDKHDKTKA
jgi:hypothetical protein